jgi:hypothetical protein
MSSSGSSNSSSAVIPRGGIGTVALMGVTLRLASDISPASSTGPPVLVPTRVPGKDDHGPEDQ